METAALIQDIIEATRERQAVRRHMMTKGKASQQKALPKPSGKVGDGKKSLPGRIARRLEKKKAGKKAEVPAQDAKKKSASSIRKDKPKKKPETKEGGGSGGKAHSPFKRKSVLGPTKAHMLRNRDPSPWRRASNESVEEGMTSDSKAPYGTRTVKKKKYWDCNKIAAYKQMCKGRGGEKMKVTIKRNYKKAYNKARKRWEKVLRHHTKRYPKGKYARQAAQ